jgi:acid phosphatase (class A)
MSPRRKFLQTVSPERLATAEQDDAFVYARFSLALGVPLDRATLPLTVALLNRSLRDVSDPVFAAKDYFHRPRPYQRLQLQHVCDQATPPKPEDHPTTGTSYPSGHSAYGWMVALVLSQVAPSRAPELLQRAQDYAESRVICGVHFESDVAAGRVVAVATVTRLESDPGFQAALTAARAEVQTALKIKPLRLPD